MHVAPTNANLHIADGPMHNDVLWQWNGGGHTSTIVQHCHLNGLNRTVELATLLVVEDHEIITICIIGIRIGRIDQSQIVFEGLVRSGLLPSRGLDRDRDRSSQY